ncbi:MAG: ATP-binding protein [Prolixibacteraceae bacterium]|nr:ATP-binding protein [Prolixibacteraceae bacterium]
MIFRKAQENLIQLSSQFKAVAIIGPRQSGKTTLAKAVFPDKACVSLENLTNREFAVSDPQGFLNYYSDGAIIDEIQNVPELFSYLQQILDETKETGKFILTGSNNFLLQENITQSLAGRIAYQILLPFSINEIETSTVKDQILKGFYPPLYDQPVNSTIWLENYITTYIERDVRQLKNISNLGNFKRFVQLCAGRTGQLLNMSSIGIELGIDHKTVQSWLSILESSFIIYRLYPHYKNFNKRLVKMPKIYFYDTGLLCSLMGIRKVEQLTFHPLYGSIFENFVISEFYKKKLNLGIHHNFYFWRDKSGHEIDLIIENGLELYPVEIKSGKTITSEYFKNIDYWKRLSGNSKATIIYDGDSVQKRSNGTEVIPWRNIFADNQLPV